MERIEGYFVGNKSAKRKDLQTLVRFLKCLSREVSLADLTAELIWVGDGSPVLIGANREKIKGLK
jgi:hypothetical protein